MARGEVADAAAEEILKRNGITVDEDEPEIEDDSDDPPYRLVGEASIPVSKSLGKRYQTNLDASIAAFEPQRLIWERAYKAYRACSGDNVDWAGTDIDLANANHFANGTDENLTRETVKTLLRNTYSRNPTINLVTIDASDDEAIECYKALVNELLGRVQPPGLNGKARIRRWIMHGHLTNFGVIRLDWQAMKGSRAEAQKELLRLQEDCAKERDLDKLDELYAELEQAEDELSTSRDPGLIMNNIQSPDLLIDFDVRYTDLSDAKWAAEYVNLGNSYLKRRYMKKVSGKWVRIVDGKAPGVSWDGTSTTSERNVVDAVVAKVLGTTSDEVAEARAKDKTRCVMVWDKMTRLISLWVDGQWDCPLYVWRDDLKLSRFYPYFIMSFAEPVDSVVQEGEQAQYHGLEQEVNKINKRVSFIRRSAFGTLIYNTRKVTLEAVTKLINHLKNPEEFDAFGMDWDPASKLKDQFDMFVPPDVEIEKLYDKSDLMRNINRINSNNEVSQGGQFKTNTTNRAVEAYTSVQASIKNELTDSIEDALKDLIWAMLELIVSKYSQEQVIALVGQKLGSKFKNMEVEEFNATYSCEIASGSTEKPTSENMKAEAMSIAQAIGQVGQATPMTTLKIIFRMFKNAFSIFSFRPDDEQMLNQEAAANLTKGVSTPNGAPPQTGGSPTPPPAAT